MSKLLTWKEVPKGGWLENPGNAVDYETGDWRSIKPIWIADNCIHCLRCWVFCPDASIMTKDGKMIGIDYKHCKGCGICANECPAKPKALEMVNESDSGDK